MNIKNEFMINGIIRFLIGSSSCIFCGKLDRNALFQGICLNCQNIAIQNLLEYRGNKFCLSCGQTLLSEKNLCSDCRKEDILLANNTLFFYYGIGKDLLYFYKFKGYKRLASYFAMLINEYLIIHHFEDYTIVAVPPSPGKIKKKGWDQVALIVKQLVTHYGWKNSDLLGKKSGVVQKQLGKDDRKKMIIDRFYLKTKENLPLKVMIIDDVLTTGSTMRECYKKLNDGGIEIISSITIARDC